MKEEENDKMPSLFSDKVAAGFPFEARDDVERVLDLNKLCVRNPLATYFVRAGGRSMEPAGIFDGDILVVDKSVEVRNHDVVVAALQGAFTVKYVEFAGGVIRLIPANKGFDVIEVPEDSLEFFGVVTSVVHFPSPRFNAAA